MLIFLYIIGSSLYFKIPIEKSMVLIKLYEFLFLSIKHYHFGLMSFIFIDEYLVIPFIKLAVNSTCCIPFYIYAVLALEKHKIYYLLPANPYCYNPC